MADLPAGPTDLAAPGLTGEVLDALRERLATIGFTPDGVHALLGVSAHDALGRNETTPAYLATDRVEDEDRPLATVIRLWLLQRAVPRDEVEAALPGLVEPLVAGGLIGPLEPDSSGPTGPTGLTGPTEALRALVDVRPYGEDDHDWWVIADLTPGLDGARPVLAGDHVLGVNSAATTLAELSIHRDVSTALDVGSGCGLHSLHLATQAEEVTAIDLNPRAAAMTGLTARLNDTELEVLEGSLFAPVAGRRFDLVLSNPPFVVSPGTGADGLTYRDSGYAGDEICRRFVEQVPEHLTDGGVCQLLANWAHVRGEDWRDRVRGWLAGSGCDAWVIEREVSDPAAYVEIWLKDAGLHGTDGYRERYAAWRSWFAEQDVEGIGFGWILLRRTSDTPVVVAEEWPHQVAQPLGPAVEEWLDRVDWLRGSTAGRGDAGLREARLVLGEDVGQEQFGRPGAADPEHIVLRQRRGLCRADRLDTAEAGFVGACDATLTVEQIVGALADLLDEDGDELAARLLPRVRGWVLEGYLEPAPA